MEILRWLLCFLYFPLGSGLRLRLRLRPFILHTHSRMLYVWAVGGVVRPIV